MLLRAASCADTCRAGKPNPPLSLVERACGPDTPMAESGPVHVPVMVDQVVHWLDPKPGQVIVDATLGGGGHARALAQCVEPGGLIVGLDRDGAAVTAAEKNLAGLPLRALQANFADLPEVLDQWDIHAVHGILMDLGVSSDQLADPGRGFSFSSTGPLDLRFDPTQGEPARRLVNRLGAVHLAELIHRYGEERYARRIARAIVEHRPIESSAQLADVIRRGVPGFKGRARIDPATRTFQALRIAVNDELKWLEVALRRLPECLKPGGRWVVIGFHSLEDRLVKAAFRRDGRLRVLTPKPVQPGEAEIARNPRARSAKLRAAERI